MALSAEEYQRLKDGVDKGNIPTLLMVPRPDCSTLQMSS